MSSSLDLNILPLARQEGRDLPEIPGLHAVTPPRRTARGRSTDSLIIYLTTSGNARLPPEVYEQLFPRLTRAFYKTTGSTTAAMRALAEELNRILLDRNLRSTGAGRQVIGLLTIGVLRGDKVYLAHCGPMQSYLIAPQGTEHMHDPDMSDRGLGLSRTTHIRYYQCEPEPGDHLVFASHPPAGWTQETLRPARHGLSGMRRRLLDHAPVNVNAVLVQAQAGTGKLRLLRLKTEIEDMARAPEVEDKPDRVAEEHPTGAPAVSEVDQILPRDIPEEEPEPQRGEAYKPIPGDPLVAPLPAAGSQLAVDQPKKVEEDRAEPAEEELPPEEHPEPVESVSQTGIRRSPAPAVSVSALPSEEAEPLQKRSRPRLNLPKVSLAPLAAVIGAFGRALGNTFGVIGRGLSGLLKNILPDESVLRLSPSVMVFIAVAVPLLISIIGGTVYVQRGRAAQHQTYYEQALVAAEQARAQAEPDNIRAAWGITLDYLDQAEFYAVSDESSALRAQARNALDQLDSIIRLDFQPAVIGGLGDNVNITQMVATANDLYMLDSEQGVVKRAFLTGQGYEIDANFICGPSFGQTIIGKLVDIVSLPRGTLENATLLAMDRGANIMYCTPDGGQPFTAQLAPPNTGFGEPIGFTLDMGDLYVLDPPVNAVWIFRNMETAQQPRFFFGDQIPPMQDVIDLAVNNDDMYLLHSDGHITTCIYSNFQGSPTRCEDPATYVDPRPGRENGAVIPDALFNQVYFSPPPNPSLYMLDPAEKSVYYFSLRLALQNQYRAIEPLPEGPATAFAVSPNRIVFLAVGNQVFYAALP